MNLSGTIVFQEKFEFLKSGIWFHLYASSDKDTFFDSFGTEFHISNFWSRKFLGRKRRCF